MVEVDLTELTSQFTALQDAMKSLEEKMTPPESLQSLKEKTGASDPVPFDYRRGIAKRLTTWEKKADMLSDYWNHRQDVKAIATRSYNEETRLAEYSLHESKVAELTETIGSLDPDCCIPELWADDILRTHVYPGSVFLNAWFINWNRDIENKPGDTVHWCRVGPALAHDLGCEEPTSTAATVDCPSATLSGYGCSYFICKDDIEDVQVGLVDALNEGLGTCLEVRVDNYFFDIALGCTNAGTLVYNGRMTGSLIAEAMGSMQAGTYEPVKFIMHSVPYKHLMQDSQFVNAATFGNRDVIASGRIKEYLGVEINETPKGTLVIGGGTYRSLMLARGALGGALKHGIEVETEYSPRQRRRWVIASIRLGGVCLHNDGIFWVSSVET